jgi:hypothetical protein
MLRKRWSAHATQCAEHFEALGEQITGELDVDDAILDSESIATDETSRPQFYGRHCHGNRVGSQRRIR